MEYTLDLSLDGRRALVTGSTSGIGEAIARLLAAEGAAVVIHGRNPDRARAVADSIRAGGGIASIALGDLETDAGADEVFAEATRPGPIDVLVNNAGTYDHLPWAEATADTWASLYNTNVLSGVRMIHRLVPLMRERGWGRIVTIGGALAAEPMAAQPHYNASLAARHNLATSLARDLSGTGVTSNVVSPGPVLLDSFRDLITAAAPENGWTGSWEEIERQASAHLVPNDIGRFGRPHEIAGAVAYLASELAAYITGATIRIDGGTSRSAF